MISAEQREFRRKFIGSSDAAAILGLDPYHNAGDIYRLKTHQTVDLEENEAMKVGKWLEPSVLNWGAAEMGVAIIQNPPTQIHENGIVLSHPDGITEEKNEIFEGKVCDIINQFGPKKWGQADTDEIPGQYLIQGQVHLACRKGGPKVCHYPVLLGGVGLRMFRVERDDELIEHLITCLEAFWKNHVLAGVPPPQTPSEETLKRIIRVANKTVKIDSELVMSWREATDFLHQVEKYQKETKAKVIAELGDAEAGECDLGTVTYYEQKRDTVCQACGDCKTSKPFRVARLKEPKGAKKNAA